MSEEPLAPGRRCALKQTTRTVRTTVQAMRDRWDPETLEVFAERFTGVDAPYEPPEQPELRIETETIDVSRAVERILAALPPRADD